MLWRSAISGTQTEGPDRSDLSSPQLCCPHSQPPLAGTPGSGEPSLTSPSGWGKQQEAQPNPQLPSTHPGWPLLRRAGGSQHCQTPQSPGCVKHFQHCPDVSTGSHVLPTPEQLPQTEPNRARAVPLKNLMMSVKSMLFSRMMSRYISTRARAMKST